MATWSASATSPMNIADRALLLREYPEVELPIDIRTMGNHAGRMIRLSIQALLEADAKLAESILADGR